MLKIFNWAHLYIPARDDATDDGVIGRRLSVDWSTLSELLFLASVMKRQQTISNLANDLYDHAVLQKKI